MKKKGLLLAISSMSCLAVICATLFVAKNNGANAFALNRGVPASEYSITMSGANCTRVNSNLLRSSTDSGSWSFDFYKTGDSSVAYGSFPFYGGGDAFLSFQGNDSYSYLNNKSGHGIFGITSITVNYCRQTNYVDNPSATSAGEDGDLKILYGYIDSEGFLQYETTSHDLSVNSPYDMSDLQPRYFKITGSNDYKTEYTYGRINIESIKICYSCDNTRSDAAVREKIFSNLFEVEPVKNGNVWTYGYYPQSLSGLSDIFELDFDSDTWEPLDNGYYLLQGEFYARIQAEGTGYNDEYTVGDYYWFKVEPVVWRNVRTLTTGGTPKYGSIIVSEKVLDTSIYNPYENDPSAYTAETSLGAKMNELFETMLPSSRTTHLTTSNLQNDIESNCQTYLFPLKESSFTGNSTSFADGTLAKEAVATDYARSRSYSKSDITSAGKMSYWTRTKYNGYFEVVTTSGTVTTTVSDSYVDRWNSMGVRPSIKIKWSN